MDLKKMAGKVTELVKKYRYPILILLVGVVFMLMPDMHSGDDDGTPEQITVRQEHTDMSTQLADILEQIDGVGKVKVMLTVAAGETSIYQTDDDISEAAVRKDTVIITDSDRNDQALIVQVLPESYRGAIIVCQGGDKASVKLAVIEAVSKATGLDPAYISVLKMK